MFQILFHYYQAEQKKQAAMEKEREARQAKRGQEREEARQKIRDKVSSVEVFSIAFLF